MVTGKYGLKGKKEKKMIKTMMNPKYEGTTISISLTDFGYKDYFVECTYHFVKAKDKYALSMWLARKDLDDRMKLSSKKIDTQFIHGTKDTIMENVCRVVHQMCMNGSFDSYVERYEYELDCFEKGNEMYEAESLANINDTQE